MAGPWVLVFTVNARAGGRGAAGSAWRAGGLRREILCTSNYPKHQGKGVGSSPGKGAAWPAGLGFHRDLITLKRRYKDSRQAFDQFTAQKKSAETPCLFFRMGVVSCYPRGAAGGTSRPRGALP